MSHSDRRRHAGVPFMDLGAQHRPLRRQLLSAFGRVLSGARFILGPEVKAFERETAARCGVRHAVGLNSGTDALLLALRAAGVGPGDEVIVPDFTFIATASAVLLAGAKPVLADIEPECFTLAPAAAAAAVTRRTRALLPVHLYGQPADMTALRALARARKLTVIEDAAQALGAVWRGRPVGSLGDAAALSFYPTKNLGALGDAGAVVTRRAALAERVRLLRDHGSARKYRHVELGYNSRLDELQAAALRVKGPHLEEWNARRRAVAAAYTAGLRECPGLVLPRTRPGARHVYHQYALRTPDRDRLQAFLAARGIGTAVHYPLPLHRQPMLASAARGRRFPVSERAAREVLCLPIAPEVSDAGVRHVIAAVRAFCLGRGAGAARGGRP